MAPAEDPDNERRELSRLFQQYAEELRTFAFGLVRNSAVADDLVQAAFVKLAHLWKTIDSAKIKAWLFQVVFNEAQLWRRKQGVERRGFEQVAARLHDRDRDRPDAEMIRRESVERVKLALNELPPEQREVVRLRLYEGWAFQRIADEQKVPIGTVLTRMRLACEKLGMKLKD